MTILLTSENGHLYELKNNKLKTLFSYDDYLMGIAKHKNDIFLCSKSKLFCLNKKSTKKFKPPCDFHHMEVINNLIYTTATRTNEIWIFDLDLNLINKHKILPPNKDKKSSKPNYNHINKIIKHKNKFYVNLNWLTDKQFGPSGVAILDNNMKEIDRISFGWQTHGFRFVDGEKYVLCASNPNKKIYHPHKAGLMVEGEIVFEHDPNKYFCKDFVINDKFIWIVGGQIQERDKRKNANGIIFILDRKFNKLEETEFPLSGGFKGIMIDSL